MAGLDRPMQTRALNLFWHKAELRLVEQPEPEAPLFAISRPTFFGGREEFILQYPARLEPPTKRDLDRHRFTVSHGKKRRSFQAPDASTFNAWLSALEKALEPKRESDHFPTPSTTNSTATTATTSQGRVSTVGSNDTNSQGRLSIVGSNGGRTSTRRRASSAARAPALRLTLERPCFTRNSKNSKLIRLHRPAPTIVGAASTTEELVLEKPAAIEDEEVRPKAAASNNDGLEVEDDTSSVSGDDDGPEISIYNHLDVGDDDFPDMDATALAETTGIAKAAGGIVSSDEDVTRNAEEPMNQEAEPEGAAKNDRRDVQNDDGGSNGLTVEVGQSAVLFRAADSLKGPADTVEEGIVKHDVFEGAMGAAIDGCPAGNESPDLTSEDQDDNDATFHFELAAIAAKSSDDLLSAADPFDTAAASSAAVVAVCAEDEVEDTISEVFNDVELDVKAAVEALVDAVIQADDSNRVDVSSVAVISVSPKSRITKTDARTWTRSATLVTKHKWVPLDPTNSRLIWVRCSVESDMKSAPRSNPRRRAINPARRWVPIDPSSTRLVWIRRVENAAARIEARYKATSSTRKWVPLDPNNSRFIWVRRQIDPAGSVSTLLSDRSSFRLYRQGKQRQH